MRGKESRKAILIFFLVEEEKECNFINNVCCNLLECETKIFQYQWKKFPMKKPKAVKNVSRADIRLIIVEV